MWITTDDLDPGIRTADSPAIIEALETIAVRRVPELATTTLTDAQTATIRQVLIKAAHRLHRYVYLWPSEATELRYATMDDPPTTAHPFTIA